MRIGEINQYNYTEFMELFSKKSGINETLSAIIRPIAVHAAGTNLCFRPTGVGEDGTGRVDWKKIMPVPKEQGNKGST